MNKSTKSVLLILIAMIGGFATHAQYKAPSQYFPKSRPIPNAPNGQPSAPKQPPASPQPAKFKDVMVNSQFYFLVDTNRAHAWMKISATAARNSKSGVTQAINGETHVQK